MWERRPARAVQHPRCELTPWKPFGLLRGRNLGEDPCKYVRCLRLHAEGTPTRRIYGVLSRKKQARAPPRAFADMSPGGDEDLDWLYGRDRQQAEPERTRVMPSPSGPAAAYSPRVVPDPPPTRTAQPRPGP